MHPNSPVGEIEIGGQPSWAFDLLGTTSFWLRKSEELDRMVELGFMAWREDVERIRAFVKAGSGEFSHKPATLTVSFFMASLAIENLLKAVLIREHPEYIKNGKFRGELISLHNLTKIATAAGVELSNDQEDFCELGTECILSFGRYHMGKSVAKSPSRIVVKETAFTVYESFYAQLRQDIARNPLPVRTKQSGGEGHS